MTTTHDVAVAPVDDDGPVSDPPDTPPPPSRARRIGHAVRRWYGRLLLVVALLWLVYTVARRLLSGHWHWSILLDAAPPLALLLIPTVLLLCAAAAAGRARRAAAVVALVGVVLSLDQTGLNWHGLRPDDRPVPPGAIHVVVWNTQYWEQWDEPGRLYAFLKRQNADVYLLQEHVIWESGTGEVGYYELPDTELLRKAFPGYHIARRGELLTMSRFPIVAQPPVGPDKELSADPNTPFKKIFDRVKVLRTDLRVGDRILSAYNVHVTVQTAPDFNEPDGFDYDGYYRRKFNWRQEEIRGLEDDVAANSHPMLIGGDMNSTAAMGNMDRLQSLARDALHANRDLVPLSWKFDAPVGFVWDSPLAKPLPFWRVDWAFTRGPVEVHRYDFVSAERLSDHQLQDLWISVHDTGGSR